MTLHLSELERGVKYWMSAGWPPDFHRSFYLEMAAADPDGEFTETWWASFLPVLRAWRATRPRGSDLLTARARARFTALRSAWSDAVRPHLGSDIAEVEWRDVAAFPSVVTQIKDADSPVFAAKFCHFLAPAIFPVVDNAAMGNPYATYAQCFNAYKREWSLAPEELKRELTGRLRDLIGKPIDDGYPLKNKAIELCLIGRCHA